MVRDPRDETWLRRALGTRGPDGGDERGDLPQGRARGQPGRLPDLRLDLAACHGAAPRGHRHPRRAVREALQRELRRRAQSHPDEEHHVRGRARGAARDRRRGDPPAPHRELLEEARAGGRQHEGGAARVRLREGAPALPAAAAHRAHERHRGPRDDRRQHRRRPRRGVRGRDRRPLVPDHAVHFADGRVQGLLLEAARRPGDRQGRTTR